MSDTKGHIVVAQTVMIESTQYWLPIGRFESVKDAQTWMKREAQPGHYNILAFRYEGVEVSPPAPQPTRNEVDFGTQHIVRRSVTEDGTIQHE